MFGNVRGGNYGAVGQQINKQNLTLNQINMESSPDYGKIAEESIKGRSRERRAAIEAEAQVHRVGLDAMGTKKVYEIDAKTEKAVADIKRPAKRFAGIVGAAGEIAGAAVLKKFNDEAKEREKKWEERFEERMRLTEQALSRPYPKPPAIEKPPMRDPVNFETPGSTPQSGKTQPTNKASGGEISMRYMGDLTKAGYTPTQAAALVGHLRYESGDFQHMEELVTNRHGTKGYGHLQWTDPVPGKGRRTNFTNWTTAQNLDPTSYEANWGFLHHEMTSGGGWNRGGSDAGFRLLGTLEDASTYLHDRYIRPSEGSRGARITLARETLNQWNKLNGG